MHVRFSHREEEFVSITEGGTAMVSDLLFDGDRERP